MVKAQRTSPVTPEGNTWVAAQTEFDAGKVLRFSVEAGDEPVLLRVTVSWLQAYRTMPLSLMQRSAIRTACIQIARDRIHPCLGKRQVPAEPLGGWMASPCPGITLTWRPHWGDADLPVMMTLERA